MFHNTHMKPWMTLITLFWSLNSSCCENTTERHIVQQWNFFTGFLPVTDKIESNTICRIHTQFLIQEIHKLELWAVKMYDSTGKLPSGILNGNINQFGDYEQCLSVAHKPTGIRGKYCLATIFINIDENYPNKKLTAILDMAQSYKAFHMTHSDDVHFMPAFTPISWGICIPSSCEPSDLQTALEEMLSPYNKSEEGLDLRVVMKEDACEALHPNNIFTLQFILFMLVLWSIFFLAVFGWIYENYVCLKEKEANFALRVALAFSLQRNWNTLINTDPLEDDIKCVHGIRFIFSVTIYLLHRTIFGLFVPFTNRTAVAEAIEGDFSMIFRAFWNHVDSFVLLSGLLSSYYAVKKLQEGRSLNILSMYLRRYIKFTPLFMVVIYIIKTLSYVLRSGPQVHRVLKHFVNSCSNVWKPLLYVSNLDGIDKMCYPPSHQLVTDMQMYILLPFLVFFLWRWQQRGMHCLILIAITLSIYRGSVIYSRNCGSIIFYGIRLSMVSECGDQLYLNPIHRLTPYILGVILGYFLRMHRVMNKQLSKETKNLCWGLATAATFYCFLGPKEGAQRGYIFNLTVSAVYGTLQPILWGAALSWVIYLCHTQQAVMLNRILSWKGFIVFTRISYAFYLIQMCVIFWNITGTQTPIYAHASDIINLNEIVFTLFLSVLFTLLYLLPLGELVDIFMSFNKSRGKSLTNLKEETKTD